MVHEIRKRLEEVPEDMKTVFRVVQNLEKAQNLEHGETAAIYNYREREGLEGESRWMKLGRYNSEAEMLEAEYLLTYEPDKKQLGAQMLTGKLDPEINGSKLVSVPEKIYKSGLENLHEVI